MDANPDAPAQKPAEAQPASSSPAPRIPAKPVPESPSLLERRIARKVGLSNRIGWVMVVGATTLVFIMFLVIFLGGMLAPGKDPGPVRLGDRFFDSQDDFAICPPVNWALHDRIEGTSIVIAGPNSPGFSPIIMVGLEVSPGGLGMYMPEHKRRLEKESASLVWVAEQEDFIDGCRAMRLEYEFETDDKVPVRAVQYVLEDKPRFYRITCAAARDIFEKHLPKFEASARSFERTKIPVQLPKIITEEGPKKSP